MYVTIVCKNTPVWIIAFRYMYLSEGVEGKTAFYSLNTLQKLYNVLVLQRAGCQGKKSWCGCLVLRANYTEITAVCPQHKPSLREIIDHPRKEETTFLWCLSKWPEPSKVTDSSTFYLSSFTLFQLLSYPSFLFSSQQSHEVGRMKAIVIASIFQMRHTQTQREVT